MDEKKYPPLKVGAHMSISQGYEGALRDAASIQSTTMQIFTANQRQWASKIIDAESLKRYLKELSSSNITEIMSHASYLINLGSPSEEVLLKSRVAFQEEIERCLALKMSYLNFHPGAALTDSREKCLDRIVESLLSFAPLLHNKEESLTLLLEMTAGQGSVVGNSFEEVAYILERTSSKVPIGVCIDTCHIFVAGYDIRTEKAWQDTLFEFDRIIGIDMLKALHVNDSQKDLGSRVDRHSPLGEGMIGLESFRALVRHPYLSKLPMYLETPGGLELWKREIALLHQLQHK
jgi:deoxyribonuclease-4